MRSSVDSRVYGNRDPVLYDCALGRAVRSDNDDARVLNEAVEKLAQFKSFFEIVEMPDGYCAFCTVPVPLGRGNRIFLAQTEEDAWKSVDAQLKDEYSPVSRMIGQLTNRVQ